MMSGRRRRANRRPRRATAEPADNRARASGCRGLPAGAGDGGRAGPRRGPHARDPDRLRPRPRAARQHRARGASATPQHRDRHAEGSRTASSSIARDKLQHGPAGAGAAVIKLAPGRACSPMTPAGDGGERDDVDRRPARWTRVPHRRVRRRAGRRCSSRSASAPSICRCARPTGCARWPRNSTCARSSCRRGAGGSSTATAPSWRRRPTSIRSTATRASCPTRATPPASWRARWASTAPSWRRSSGSGGSSPGSSAR